MDIRLPWSSRDSRERVFQNRQWRDGFYAAMRHASTGGAYVNFADPVLDDYLRAYYGSNLTRLIDAKAKSDPDNLFHFAQSIPTTA